MEYRVLYTLFTVTLPLPMYMGSISRLVWFVSGASKLQPAMGPGLGRPLQARNCPAVCVAMPKPSFGPLRGTWAWAGPACSRQAASTMRMGESCFMGGAADEGATGRANGPAFCVDRQFGHGPQDGVG